MKSKECLEILKDEVVPDSGYLDYEDYGSYENEMLENYNIIKQDLDRLEQLEKEHEKLKERYKHRAETSKDLCEAVKQYEKAFEILQDKVQITLYDKNSWVENYGIKFDMLDYEVKYLTQQEYELLKEVLENVKD